MDETFIRDFFGMAPRKKPEKEPVPPPRQITIECQAADPIEVRAENIVKMIGFLGGGGGGYSIPSVSPAEATLRVIKVLRKYAEQDAVK